MDVGTVSRLRAIAEPLSLYALIMIYIWRLRFVESRLWIVILGLMLLSHVVHRERPRELGFGLQNLRECADRLAPAMVLLFFLLLAGGLLLHTTRHVGFGDAFTALAGYIPWGLLQQYVLNGYFLNRLSPVFRRSAAPFAAAVLFSSAHAPNLFLMVVTLIGGYCAARVYQRYRNLYFLGLAHAAAGFLLYLVVPDSISHHLRVGPRAG
jgi:membrane protease YdiL (CAAX protease family)